MAKTNYPKVQDPHYAHMRTNLWRLRPVLQLGINQGKCARCLPTSLFAFALEDEVYNKSAQDFSRLLHDHGDQLFFEFVRRDMTQLQMIRWINTCTAKSFFYNMFKLANKEVMGIVEYANVKEALEHPQKSPVMNRSDTRTNGERALTPKLSFADGRIRMPPKCQKYTRNEQRAAAKHYAEQTERVEIPPNTTSTSPGKPDGNTGEHPANARPSEQQKQSMTDQAVELSGVGGTNLSQRQVEKDAKTGERPSGVHSYASLILAGVNMDKMPGERNRAA